VVDIIQKELRLKWKACRRRQRRGQEGNGKVGEWESG